MYSRKNLKKMGDMTAGEEENLIIQEISNKLNLIEKHKLSS